MIVTVDSGIFRQVISQLSYIYKNNEVFRAFNLSIDGNILSINANTGVRYEANIALSESYSERVSLNLLYKDISDILSSKGVVTLDILPMSCTIYTGAFNITLSLANDVVEPLRHHKPPGCKCIDAEAFRNVTKTLSSTATFKKAYKLTPVINFNGKYAYAKFSTVWIERLSGLFSCNITQDIIDIMVAFEPYEYSEGADGLLYLYNSMATLIVPVAESSDTEMDTIVKPMEQICTIDASAMLIALKKMMKVLGDGMATMFISEHGIKLRVIRVGVTSVIQFGTEGEILATAQIPLEFIFNAFSLTPGNVTILYGGGKLCLCDSLCRILMSVSN